VNATVHLSIHLPSWCTILLHCSLLTQNASICIIWTHLAMHICNVHKLGKELWSFIPGKIRCCGTLTAGVHGIKVEHHKSSTASNNIYYYLSHLTLLYLVHSHFCAAAATCCQLLFCCSLLSLQILPCAAILHFSHFFKPSMHISTYTVIHTWNSEFYFKNLSEHLSFLLIVAYDLMQVLITMTYEYWSTKFIVVLYKKCIANCLSGHLPRYWRKNL